MKICKKCGVEKELNDFQRRTDTGKIRGTCKTCRLKQIQQWQDDNREQTRNNQRKYITTPRNRIISLYNSAKTRARHQKVDFKLTLDDIAIGISAQGCCARTGIPFDFNMDYRHENKLRINPFSPSIDKINPQGIYERSNVQYVCSWYNFAKNQFSDEFLISMCKLVVNKNVR